MWSQTPALFLCHQKDGNACAGWLACHDPRELLAVRMARDLDRSVYDYSTTVPVFSSGAEARRHGMRDIRRPGAKAHKMMAGLIRQKSAE
jgi:hypothetical protein